ADRGIYRPGSDIVLHAIVRGPRLAVPEPFPVQFRLTRPDGRHYETLTAKLSKWGTAEVTVPVPRYALTGRYGVELRLPGAEEAIGRHGVRVEEFLPNRMKAEVVAADRRYRAGETLRFTVQAAHLFGSPAAGRAVEVTCRYQPMTFAHPDWAGYRFADGGKDFAAVDSQSRSATLDEQGETTFEVEVPETFACPSSIDVVISATVKEVGGRGVTTHLARHVDPYPRYVGLARASDEHAAIGRTERFRCALVQPDGTPVPQATLTGQVYRVIWHTVLHRNDRGRLRYISESQEEPVGELECAIADGRGTVAFQPEEYGQYILRMRDEEGGASADLRFYCSGRGSVPWAMEKPHRIELTADRKAYAPGDEAVVLVKAPFPGQALFTVESDRVHLARTVAMTANTTEFRFPVDPAFGPNAYCTATVVRKVEPAEQWSAHRAYGAAPIRLDAEPRHLTVEVEAAEEVRPGMPLRVALRVRDASGAGRPAEVSLAAVDEGICQLTRYRTPDPWDFFYAKRALGVNTSDVYALLMPEMATEAVGSPSATGGDDPEGPTYDPRLFNPVAVERVRQVALWRSGIETDAAGRAEVLLDVPEFTGQLRLMAVASGRSAFGAAERPTLVKQPLMVRASFPRFLAPGDELTVPVTVFNHSAADGAVRLKAEATGGVAFATAEPEAIDVPSDGERTVLLTAHALAVPGPAAMIVTARLGEETAVAEVELPVRPATSLRHEAGSGAVEAGAKARIPIPGGWMKGTDDYALSFSAKPTLKLGESLRYLLRYPYGCIEQTTSSAFPLLYLGDLAETVDPERFDHTAVEGYLQAGIDRVLSMQASNGGFGSWPGYWRVYRWGSVYATHFLVEAKKAGHDVHQDNLGAALDHLEAILSHSDANRATKAYACYVLALAGRPNASWTYRLWEERQEMAAYSRVHIALALSMKQERQIVAGFLDSAKLPPVTKRRDTGGVLHSSTRESAMLLSGFLDLNPEHPHVPVLVQRLDAAMSDGRWLTTQENAFATLALGKYARHLKEQEIDLQAKAALDGETLAEFTHEDQVRLQPESLGGRTVEVSTEGQGTLYYYWTAEGIPLADDGRTKDEGLTVRRRLLDREGRELSAGPIPHGAIVVVELTVQADRPVDNVVINDLLPAGFEIENPKLQTSESVQIPGNHEAHPLNPDRVERRDDRLLVFGDIVSTKTLHHRYVVRAVTRGRFRLPAVHAVAMYDPAVCSVHGGGTIELR
ncbi:MAG: alpha-2-macroglobulin family protein, partial [Planctomycetota bacterium]